MPHISEYYNMAKVLSSKMDHELAHFFDDYMSRTGGIEIQSQMTGWTSKAKSCHQYDSTVSFLNYVWFILSSEDSEAAKEPRDKYFEKRRQARIYWTRVVKKEQKNGYDKGLLKDDCTSYFDLLRLSNNDDMKRYSSEEEYLDARYASVIEWGKDTASNLIAFPEIFHLKPKKIADYFFLDCAFKAFDYILKHLYGNVLTGYYTIIPQLVNEGLFSLSSFSKEMQPTVRNDALILVDNVNDKYNTVVEKIEGDFSDAVKNGRQNEIVESFVKSGKLSLTNDVLDSFDQSILITIYSSFSVEDINQGSKRIPLTSIVKQVYGGRIRRDYYINVSERLRKMAKYKVEIKETNSQGNLVGAGIISFFDLIFKTGEISDDNTHTDVAIIDGSAQKGIDIVEALNKIKDFSQLDVDIMPSQYIKTELRKTMNERNIKILTSLYKEELPSRAKKMLTFLIEERTAIYPSLKCTIPYDTFITKLRLEEPKKKRLLEQIRHPISQLKEKGVLVENFTMNEYSIEIVFFPMSDMEEQLYNLDKSDNLLDVDVAGE